jgi:short-subunit dehydrogenase
MKVEGKVWVVTGGGSGMGRELALLLAEKGVSVAIADVDDEGMKGTLERAGDMADRFSTHELDITDREAVRSFPQNVIDTHRHVDGLINCAGIIQPFVPVKDLEDATIERIMRINFYGTLDMTRAFLPHLSERPEAHIVNVSSMGGFIPFPGQTIYSASKGAVKMLTEGLYAELKSSKVRVTLILPGGVNTKIMSNSGVERAGGSDEDTGSYKVLEADEAARIMLRGIEKDKFRVLVGKDARFLDLFYRFHPAKAVRFIVKKMGD